MRCAVLGSALVRAGEEAALVVCTSLGSRGFFFEFLNFCAGFGFRVLVSVGK